VTNDNPWRLADLSFAPSGNGRERATINGVEVVRENGRYWITEAIIDKISEDLPKVTLDPELQKKLAPLGSYTNPMSPAEATAFVHRQQQTWQPVLDEIAKNER
jgi:tripartite-type tricarboxylate transporter receptor subunit TctC